VRFQALRELVKYWCVSVTSI